LRRHVRNTSFMQYLYSHSLNTNSHNHNIAKEYQPAANIVMADCVAAA